MASEVPPLSTNEREKRTRINRMIRISPVRVIGPQGEQLGVLPVEEALAAAQERGLDLVEVAPTARPPVVKIMDYGKFKFEEAKAARAAKKKQHIIQLKEVKYRPRYIMVTLTLFPSPRNSRACRVLNSKSWSSMPGRYFTSFS